ncbi:cytochrome c-type biogenesis protein [Acidocella aminolytica]|jgi:cytochrome c-type biogenesis protein CcmH|uniref:Cytochrome c-type biogenesis protein n=1 Tax=Acidocella aminolytica 101 = DSM 11237 TaxID=1120923 RepID=A0A0D6PBG2_9PROT|nr:cytochrome c-type biogenesis protein [Acidocella aminolytica]GAN78676.1 cytochrome c biogenesis protein CycL/CcmH [Acidocella aminolytica 101 = DSM 11237]GBQ36647.1 cytochrome c-type biogenesis protein CycL [Acidocella aminolytica 101 = DSM 11237]SHE45074.1 cytochrome c-type biogenesis protein CcmH [Acidocella aminolytica 101 = DSM 11237]
MKIKRLLFALLLVPGLALAQAMVQRDGVILTPAQEHRAETIGSQLRCLVCQNESIEESSAGLAKQLRTIIRQQVVQGVPDKQIMQYMVHRYGIFVLLKPPVSPLTWLLYASPFLALIIGFLVYWLGRRNRAKPVAPLTEAEQARLDELLK